MYHSLPYILEIFSVFFFLANRSDKANIQYEMTQWTDCQPWCLHWALLISLTFPIIHIHIHIHIHLGWHLAYLCLWRQKTEASSTTFQCRSLGLHCLLLSVFWAPLIQSFSMSVSTCLRPCPSVCPCVSFLQSNKDGAETLSCACLIQATNLTTGNAQITYTHHSCATERDGLRASERDITAISWWGKLKLNFPHKMSFKSDYRKKTISCWVDELLLLE